MGHSAKIRAMALILSMMFVCSFLIGCATQATEKAVWRKQGTTNEEFLKARYECMRDAMGIPGPQGNIRSGYYPNTPNAQLQKSGDDMMDLAVMMGHRDAQQRMFKECMESKGWHLVPIEKLATTGIKTDQDNLKSEAIVLNVYPSSPAAEAGVKPGDKIIEKNGQPIKTVGDLRYTPSIEIGDIVEYKMLRDGKPLVFSLKAVSLENIRKATE
jgi:C-terminal processing protease CtpA/Prc